MSSKLLTSDGRLYTATGVEAPWYSGWEITEEESNKYRLRSQKSQLARNKALSTLKSDSKISVNLPNLQPEKLMPKCRSNGLTSLSLFSGGGGLDLGFDLAGFTHVASYELLDFAGKTILLNRPKWKVCSGINGDVTQINWKEYSGKVDVIHGGPPCQPFSTSGKQRGNNDVRDMIPEFVRAVKIITPKIFLIENVPGLLADKFKNYLKEVLYNPLQEKYTIHSFKVRAAAFGVPQVRTRIIFVGIKNKELAGKYKEPEPTHYFDHFTDKSQIELDFINERTVKLRKCMGAREALGLENINYDALAPTVRSTLTGPRHTTSILSSTNAQKIWAKLRIWPNGVQEDRRKAAAFKAEGNDFRLSVSDVGILQGFPESWKFEGPVYKAAGQIGNSVCPPVAYHLAKSISQIFL